MSDREINRQVVKLAAALLDACDQADASLEDQLTCVTSLWLQRAQSLRSQALVSPDGSTRERMRQLALLDTLTDAVRQAVPDLDLERLKDKGHTLAVLEHLACKNGEDGR